MKNREKYRDEILNSVFRGNRDEYCKFVKKNVLLNLTDCTDGGCAGLTCTCCRAIFVFWLDEEYEEPPKPEVDWDNVPVDTLVRVRDSESEEWALRYFKEIDDGNVMGRYSVWMFGATSKTAFGDNEHWKYCELVEDKEVIE